MISLTEPGSARASGQDERWLREAIELSRLCPESLSAYSVGAIIVDNNGVELSRGYSRESDPAIHAEESALAKLGGQATGTIYSSLEPCTQRKSGPTPCAHLIIRSGLRRVMFAWREPPLFVKCHGLELLQENGIEVVELPGLAHLVRDINSHLDLA